MEGHGRHTKIGREFGVGVIGLGEGKGLIKGLQGHPELRVLAICDVNQALVDDVQKGFAIPHAYTTLEEMVQQDDLDIVVIYTPDPLHIEHISRAFQAGKHVICTKPLVNSLLEARQVIELTKQYSDLNLMVGQSSRFFGPMQEQRRAYEAGKLGDLTFVESHYVHDMRWFYGNRAWARQGGFDLLFGGCSHPVDLVRWYFGDVDEVMAYADRSLIAQEAGFQGNDTFIVNLKFSNGRISRVLGYYGLEHPHQYRPWIEVAIYGTKGTFIANYPQLQSLQKYEGEPEKLEMYFEDIYHYFQFEGVNHHAGEFVNYAEYFARRLVSGEKAMPDAEDGFQTIATLEAIRESIKTGQPTKVERV
ncbi:MAG: Gfo/Idh/MocA family oxidoreductase [candidate division Zixibacteria bacterium]|nr:Gfo/Idh/MocA family oxidoreductase [Gammaproteobacteria bacterium]NIX58707.1 Gfo/Idh/MocA family oxidoreductase [candidate division Zixibacteria bacterium]